MLDEPTNHLDIHSCELLIEALNKYEGSLILVSHDRYFISKTANKIWEIEDRKVKEFKGGYDEWTQWKERMASKKQEKKPVVEENARPVAEKKKTAVLKEAPKPKAIDKEAKKELQRMQKNFQQLEEKIATLNREKAELELSLTDPNVYSDKQKFLETETAYKRTETEIARLNQEYEKTFDRILQLEQQQASG